MCSEEMKLLFRILLLAVTLCGPGYAGTPIMLSRPDARIVVDLAKVGWTRPRVESNRKFFKDFSIAKLEAMDLNTKITFLGEDQIAVYHSISEGPEWNSGGRQVEAFFIQATDGGLIRTKRWAIALRKSSNDLRDSEGRIIALHDGRYVAIANGVMILYAENCDLLKQLKFEPFDSKEMWAVQSVANGHVIFLRHESASTGLVTYSWLDSDTFSTLFETVGGRAPAGGVVAGENGALDGSRSGIQMTLPGQLSKTICDAPLCRGDVEFRYLTFNSLVVSGAFGVGVVDTDHGLLWSDLYEPPHNPSYVQFGNIYSAGSGARFGVWVTASSRFPFNGVSIRNSPTLFVYDSSTPKPLFAIPIKPVSGVWDISLSPSGRQLAVFDGAKLKLYSLQ
jgi:hypothetical protein